MTGAYTEFLTGSVLAEFGDADSLDLRRAKALGIIAADDPTASLHTLIDELTAGRIQPAGPAAAAAAATSDRPAEDGCAASDSTASETGAPAKKRPSAGRAVLYLHLSEAAVSGRYGVARVEDLGPVLADQVKEFLQHRNVILKPVIDLNRPIRAADAYETPADITEAVHLRSPADCFPHATSTSRRRGDLDHTEPYKPPDDGGPPGQTRADNLGRLSRLQHRIKTHSKWKVKQLRSGLWLWTSPHRYHYLVDHTGTIPLGKL